MKARYHFMEADTGNLVPHKLQSRDTFEPWRDTLGSTAISSMAVGTRFLDNAVSGPSGCGVALEL